MIKVGQRVQVFKRGQWRAGYYAGLTRWGTLYYVTAKKVTGKNRFNAPGWIVESIENIRKI